MESTFMACRIVGYGCESWTLNKVDEERTNVFLNERVEAIPHYLWGSMTQFPVILLNEVSFVA